MAAWLALIFCHRSVWRRAQVEQSSPLTRLHRTATIIAMACGMVCALASLAFANDVQLANSQMVLTVRSRDGTYEIRAKGSALSVVEAIVAAQIDHAWIKSTDYPNREISESEFEDALGSGHQITVVFTGLPSRIDLHYVLRLYDKLPFGDIQVQVQNRASATVNVQRIRVLEAVGKPIVNLGGEENSDRVLSDSFGENRPNLKIYDLGQLPEGQHRAVGSQLIYNRESKQSLFVGALTTNRFLTVATLQTNGAQSNPRATTYTIESTGTTEIQSRSLFPDAPSEEDRIELSLPVAPGARLHSERLMFAVGDDYHAQLEAYGAAIRKLYSARVGSSNLMGWWSWTAWYREINEGNILTNARWLAQHLREAGYEFFHIDSGYEYAPGEFMTPNASRFPRGMRPLTQDLSRLGLKVGIWTAPFYVGEHAWVAEHHKEWLVRNARGAPLRIMRKTIAQEGQDIFVLDTTHPGAQEYLRETYHTLVREWCVRYIKLDFMDSTAIEGYYHRPHTTALEAQRIGLRIIREAVGDDVLLDKDGSTMLNPVGIVDEGRISQDIAHAFSDTRASATAIAARYYMNRNFFVSDPDAFNISRQVNKKDIQRPLTLSEAQASIVLAAISGGMFEIGDDLPTLASEPDRLALVTNPDLLQLVKLGRAFKPLDLMTYQAEDELPSIFVLQEDSRQWILAVFNWTEQPRTHSLRLAELGVPKSQQLELRDALDHDAPGNDRPILFDDEAITLNDQPPHSVRLIKIIDASKPAAPPTITAHVPTDAKVRQDLTFSARPADDGVPALAYHWDYGDGIQADGQAVSHTYTLAGTYAVKLVVDGVDGISYDKSFSIVVDGLQEIGPPRRYFEPGTRREYP